MTEQTFLFADLAGFTALTEARGDDYAADLAQSFCRALKKRLPDGAEDFKMLRDACLVRIDRADDAVGFALALVNDLGDRKPFPPVRVGMHTAQRRSAEPIGSGRPLTPSARVAELAAGNEILSTDATLRSVGPATGHEVTDLGERHLRNLKQPHRVLHVTGEAVRRSNLE